MLDQKNGFPSTALPGPGDPRSLTEALAFRELASLVGHTRAELLCLLDRPMTMGTVAALVNITPAGITYHCDRLQDARLISRDRRGREVWIERTSRAQTLLDLFWLGGGIAHRTSPGRGVI
ncbi:winged helix-turn-helix domain-containing protein [Spongiactinospora sp. TRM90649]|uniref:winged helix-turn-helix domain-containing protein n=1 Tax=Spongiactinospora sp. TRM90649 TaxID=3031114 RepID=UPI0023F82105|nr:winged helix-turn-helix domain-containing protein [Spongiactinospora sp. TRM90649]MDF5756228.1 winged helix-turn-helix domain-containing protein [Spongiactinospora sp. TRM90649]